jgi:hypothetical protein
MLPSQYRLSTHCMCGGTTQSGKSKWCEFCIRKHIVNGDAAVFALDWHGRMYRSLVGFLSYQRPKRPVILIDPSSPDCVVPYNPFALRPGRQVSTHVNRTASLLVKPWGESNLNDKPTLERIIKMVVQFMAETGEPLHHAAQLLDFANPGLRNYAISSIANERVRQQWKTLQYIKTLREWDTHVLSTQNRLGRFLSSPAVIRFMGVQGESISLAECIRQKAIVLVNLEHSDYLDRDSARVFASLMVSELFDAAMMNANDPKKCFAYFDEASNYLSDEDGRILDEVTKSGLRVTLVFQHLGQFAGKHHLLGSMQTNAQIKVVFGGSPIPEAKMWAEEFWFLEANARKCKEERFRYVTEYEKVAYEIENSGWGDQSNWAESGERKTEGGGYSMSSSVSRGTRFEPRLRKERDGQEDWTREEKIAQLAERIVFLRKRECYIKTPQGVRFFKVPLVTDYAGLLNSKTILECKQALQKQAIPTDEVNRILQEAEARFLEKGDVHAAIPKPKPAKKRPLSPE